MPYEIYFDYDKKLWTPKCQVDMVYKTELLQPLNSWVVLTTAHDGIHVSRSGNKSAPRDQFSYIYDVQTFIPGKSDFAQNFTRLKVTLRCYYDLQN